MLSGHRLVAIVDAGTEALVVVGSVKEKKIRIRNFRGIRASTLKAQNLSKEQADRQFVGRVGIRHCLGESIEIRV